MKRQYIYLIAFLSVAILIFVFAATRGVASLRTISLVLMALFVLSGGLFWRWSNSRKREATTPVGAENAKGSLIWLLVIFTVSASVALIRATHGGWHIGDAIGLSFFLVIMGLSLVEILRRAKKKEMK